LPRHTKILEQVLRGASDANIHFDDLRHLLRVLGLKNAPVEATTSFAGPASSS
jgi:hypothetical protein